jgi:drug/metabolite transporter (DMT)-like permease
MSSTGLATPPPANGRFSRSAWGMTFGFVGVLAFSFSLPFTRMAVGSEAAPQLSGWFVSLGRAAVAGVLSALWLWAVRAAWPTAAQWRVLAVVAVGVVFAFPVCTSLALLQVQAVHASVMLGVMPLATALLGERIDAMTLGFGLAVVATVFVGRNMPVR